MSFLWINIPNMRIVAYMETFEFLVIAILFYDKEDLF